MSCSFSYQRSQIDIVSLARDYGLTSRNTSAVVRINIQDINDNVPMFNATDYVVYVKENLPENQAVARLVSNH